MVVVDERKFFKHDYDCDITLILSRSPPYALVATPTFLPLRPLDPVIFATQIGPATMNRPTRSNPPQRPSMEDLSRELQGLYEAFRTSQDDIKWLKDRCCRLQRESDNKTTQISILSQRVEATEKAIKEISKRGNEATKVHLNTTSLNKAIRSKQVQN